MSLTNAAQGTATQIRLKKITPEYRIQKPIYIQSLNASPLDPNEAEIIKIVNVWMDIEFGYNLLHRPEATAKKVYNNKFFESVGSSFYTLYSHVISLLANSFKDANKRNELIDKSNSWMKGFSRLCEQKVENHYYGSVLTVSPVGLDDIFEGQARFTQLQFLHITNNGKYTFNDWKRLGYLSEPYIKAFEVFLDMLNYSWPVTPMSPLVNLFLLVCDIAINPEAGYPDDIFDYKSFINNIQPGIRFILATHLLAKYPNVCKALHSVDKNKYEEITNLICTHFGWKTPDNVCNSVIQFYKQLGQLDTLHEEYIHNSYPTNTLVRFICSRHIEFMQDKSKYPEFFAGLQLTWEV
jgi:hypothetical protein